MLVKTSVKTTSKISFSLARTVSMSVLAISSVVGISTFLVAMTVPTVPVGHVRANPPSENSFCGNNVIEAGEQCDFSNSVSNDGDGCNAKCKWEWCGDGIVQDAVVSRNFDGSIKNSLNPQTERCDSIAPSITCTFDCQLVPFDEPIERIDGYRT